MNISCASRNDVEKPETNVISFIYRRHRGFSRDQRNSFRKPDANLLLSRNGAHHRKEANLFYQSWIRQSFHWTTSWNKRFNLWSSRWTMQKVDLLHFTEVLIFCWNIQSRRVAWFHTRNCCAKHSQYVFGSQLGGDNALHYLSQFLSLAVLSFYSLMSK